jgi:hypothetical protein
MHHPRVILLALGLSRAGEDVLSQVESMLRRGGGQRAHFVALAYLCGCIRDRP